MTTKIEHVDLTDAAAAQVTIDQLRNAYKIKDEVSLEERTVKEYENSVNHLGMYAFYDKKQARYDVPVFCHDDLFAQRYHHMQTNSDDPRSILTTFKTDFDFCRIGFLDLQHGELIPFYECLIFGNSLAKQEE